MTDKPTAEDFSSLNLNENEVAHLLSYWGDKGNAEEVENVVESNPEAAAEVLPDNTELNTEAEQITDGNDRNNEVDNDAVKGFINDYKHGLLSSMDDYYANKNKKLSRAEKKQKKQDSLDELDRMTLDDARSISEMGNTANPYTPDITNGETYGDDYKALAPTQGNNIEGSYETTDLGTDVAPNYTVEGEGITPITEGKYEVSTVPNENVEEDEPKELDPEVHDATVGIIGGNDVSHNVDTSLPVTTHEYDKDNGSLSFGSGKGILSGSGGIGSFVSQVKKPKEVESKEVEPVNTTAPVNEPVESETETFDKPSVHTTQTQGKTNNGGNFGSGYVDKTGNSLIKKSSTLEEEDKHTQDVNTIDLAQATIDNIERRIRNLDPEIAEHFDFNTSKATYHDTPISKLSGGQLNEVIKILDTVS